jgi:hypothetical protein
MRKLMVGPDGTYVKATRQIDTSIIGVVPLAPLDSSVTQAFLQAKDNFNIVTLTGSEQRGQVDRETATAAAIKNQNSQQAEAEPKTVVAQWLNSIARSIILNLRRTTNPFWVKHAEPQTEHLAGNIQPSTPQFSQMSGENLEGDDFETDIEISSISPIDNQAELQKFLQLISILNQFQEIAMSPTLVRETAKKVGYYNENVIAELQKMAQARMVAMQMQLDQGMKAAQSGSPAAQQINANNTPPQQGQIRNQLQQQLPTQ